MPSRGYRKGVSDSKVPKPELLRTRVSRATRQSLEADAANRSMTLSRLIGAILDAHVRKSRLELPQQRGPSSGALRELTRIGNNLNQIARQANLMNLPHIEDAAIGTLAAVMAAVRRL